MESDIKKIVDYLETSEAVDEMSQEEYRIVILLDNFWTRDRMINNLDEFITDWDAVLARTEQNIAKNTKNWQEFYKLDSEGCIQRSMRINSLLYI